VEDQEADLRVHSPASRIALILDLVEGFQMPGTILLTDPERIIGTGIGGLDPPWGVRATLSGDTTILHLDFGLCAAADVGCSGDRVSSSDWRGCCRGRSANDIGRARNCISNSRGGNCGDASVEGLSIRIVGWVSGELLWRVIVSIHTRIRAMPTTVTVIKKGSPRLSAVAVVI
jgi:hypothetical protein